MDSWKELTEMELLLKERKERGPKESEDIPRLDWVEDMTVSLRDYVTTGECVGEYIGKSKLAEDNNEMREIIRDAPGTHPTWLAFQEFAMEVLAEE